MTSTPDPITVEVIRNYHQSTARQMRNALIRASFNPIIYEMVDFSLGVFNEEGELLAEGPGIPLFCGAVTFAIRDVIQYVGKENLDDGDVVLSTFGYWIGSHPQDALTVRPIFVDGVLFGYAAAKAHWMDIGAKDIYSVDTTDMWQEGLQFYGVKIVKKGSLDRELVEVVRANSRLPDAVVGDMTAQLSACELGARRTLALVEKYGAKVVAEANREILLHGERIARQAIADMPDGTWSVEAALDDDGIGKDQVPLRATVTISGDRMVIDTSGSAAQTVGPMNCPLGTTSAVMRLVMKMIVAPEHDANEGFFRPLEVVAPLGSVLNPRPPAPIFLYGWTAMVLGEALFKAFAEIKPERAVARSGGDLSGILFSGSRPDGQFFAGGVDECCGQGAALDQDGENAVISYALGESRNTPAEIVEERYPVLVERYELWPDSGGAGRFRGGLGVRRRWKILSELKLICTVEQHKSPAWGVRGGRGGSVNSMVLKCGTRDEHRIGKAAGVKLLAGERIEIETGGGGGWGDPLERPVEVVLADVRGGYVTPERALEDYGVAVSVQNGSVVLDSKATDALRRGKKSRPAQQR